MIVKSDFKQEPTMSYMLSFHAGVHTMFCIGEYKIEAQWLNMGKILTQLALAGCPQTS